MHAAQNSSTECLQLLLDAGANIDARNKVRVAYFLDSIFNQVHCEHISVEFVLVFALILHGPVYRILCIFNVFYFCGLL